MRLCRLFKPVPTLFLFGGNSFDAMLAIMNVKHSADKVKELARWSGFRRKYPHSKLRTVISLLVACVIPSAYLDTRIWVTIMPFWRIVYRDVKHKDWWCLGAVKG